MPPLELSNIIIVRNYEINEKEGFESALDNFKQIDEQFQKINSMLQDRLAGIKNKVSEIHSRVDTCKLKIDRIKDLNQGITVVSPSKFVKSVKFGNVKHQNIVNTNYNPNTHLSWINNEGDYKLNTSIKPKMIPTKDLKKSEKNEKVSEKIAMIKLVNNQLKQRREMFEGDSAIQQVSIIIKAVTPAFIFFRFGNLLYELYFKP